MRFTFPLLVFAAALCFGQAPATMSGDTKATWAQIRTNLIKSADKMAEADYAFKPTPEVRSFGQLVGHVANAQYRMCSTVHPEKAPAVDIEKTLTTKAELSQALKDSAAYCDAAYDLMTDQNAGEVKKFFNRDRTRISILQFNIAHDFEHYGNMVTYMRLKGLVPPSSER